MANNKKGAILFIVLAVLLLVAVLSGVILSTVSSQSRLTNHQVNRIKAYYAAKGMMNYTLEKLRLGTAGGGWTLPATGSVKYACHRGCIDAVTETYDIPDEAGIPYKIQVRIDPSSASNPNDTAKLSIKTEYTYNP